MVDTRAMFKPNLLLFWIWRYHHFEFLGNMATFAAILNLTLTCYLNNAAMLQYGDFDGNFKLMPT